MPQILDPVTASQMYGAAITDMTSFEQACAAADGAVKAFLQTDPISQAWTETYNGRGGSMLALEHWPVTALASVSILQWGNAPTLPVDLTFVRFDKHALYRGFGVFPRGEQNIEVSYTGGYGPASPEMLLIQKATMLTIQAMWTGKDADQNVSSESFNGVMSMGFWATGPGAVPPQARSLISSLVRTAKVL